MKILINIPEDVYTRLFDNGIQDNEIAVDDVCEMARALRLGTPMPDNVTNGDIIKAMFPNTEIMITDERLFLRYGTIVMIYQLIWWNSQYQKGGKE